MEEHGRERRPDRRRLAVVGLAVLLALVAAGLWWLAEREEARAPVLAVVPRDASSVLYVPRPAELMADVRAAAETLGLADGFERLRGQVVTQLGFDPTDPQALSQHGIAPMAGLVVFTPGALRSPVVAITTTDADAFEATLTDLLRRRGGERAETRTVQGVEVRVSSAAGAEVAWALRAGVAVLAAGRGAAERVALAAATPEAQAILDDPGFQRARDAMGETQLLAYGTRAALGRAGRRWTGVPVAALGLSVSGAGAQARTYVGLSGEALEWLPAFEGAGDALALIRRLDPKAILVGRLTAEPTALWARLRAGHLPPVLDEAAARLEARGVRVEEQLLPLVQGAAAFDLRLTPSPDLSRMPSLDPRRTNPFEYVRLSVLIPVTDAERAAELLPRAGEVLGPALRARVEPETVEGHPTWVVRYQLGDGIRFGLVGDTLILAGGPDAWRDAARRLDPEAEGEGAGDGLPDAATTRLASEGALALALPVDNLVNAVHGLDAAAYGGGPRGVVLRSMVRRLAAPLSRLGMVTAVFEPAPSGVVGRWEAEFRRPEGP